MEGCVTLIITCLKYYLADCETHIHKLIPKTDISLPSTNHTYEPFVSDFCKISLSMVNLADLLKWKAVHRSSFPLWLKPKSLSCVRGLSCIHNPEKRWPEDLVKEVW